MRTAGQSIAIAFIIAILTVGSAVARAAGSGVLDSGAAVNCPGESLRDAPGESAPLIVTGEDRKSVV